MLPALAAAARFGPYFATDVAPAPSDRDGWISWARLAEPEVAAERVGASRNALIGMFGLDPAEATERVIASTVFLGWASRVVSPLLGAAVAGGALPMPGPADLWWRAVGGGPLPLAYGPVGTVTAEDAEAVADALVEGPVRTVLGPVLGCFRERFALSPKVLHGNVASALGGAAGMIADQAPQYAARAAAIVESALQKDMLRGTGRLVRARERRWYLIRNNCCLYYRIPGGGTCGDCVLTPEADRRRAWDAAGR